jgi:hypothetical protein
MKLQKTFTNPNIKSNPTDAVQMGFGGSGKKKGPHRHPPSLPATQATHYIVWRYRVGL